MRGSVLATHQPELPHDGHRLRPVILIVDDDQGVHEACQLILEDRYEILGAPDGPTALNILESSRVDLVLLDLRLPGIDGITVLAHIKETRPQIMECVVAAAARHRRARVAALREPAEGGDW